MSGLAEQIIGTWKLKDWEVAYPELDEPHAMYGGDAEGRILYTSDGWMSVMVMKRNRPETITGKSRNDMFQMHVKIIFEGIASLSAEESEKMQPIVAAALGQVSYFGKYSIEGDLVSHHLQVSSVPDFEGRTLVRRAKIENNVLNLIGIGEPHVDVLNWQRAD